MNVKQISATILYGVALVVLLSGCGKKTVDPDAVSGARKPEGHLLESTAAKGDDSPDGFSAGDLEPLDETGINPLNLDTSSEEYQEKYGRSTAPLLPVFFDFDSSAINVDQLDNLNSSGNYLLENNSGSLVVEGNCDERGTADYNLALGELRAINVKKYLVNIGVDDGIITTISYGSQRPLFLESNETSWAGNRRVDLVIP